MYSWQRPGTLRGNVLARPVICRGRGTALTPRSILVTLSTIGLLVTGCALGEEPPQTAEEAGIDEEAAAREGAVDPTEGNTEEDTDGERSDDDPLVVGDGDQQVLAALGLIAEQVAELRDLELRSPIHLDVVSSAELVEIARELNEEAADDEDLARREDRQRALEALHLLPAGIDLDEASEALIEVGVLGLFAPRTEQAYAVAEDGELSPAVSSTVAHELLHALQHQHFDLDRMTDIDEPDERFAFASVVEGDAVLIEEAWIEDHLDQEQQQQRDLEFARLGAAAQETFSELPQYLVIKQLQPYSLGERFVSRLLEEGGQEALDAAIADPPRTSAEVRDPQLYLDGFTPTDPLPLTSPAGDWQDLHASRFGAWQVDVYNATMPRGHPPIGQYWRGGEMEAWTDDEGRVIAAFSVTFDGDAGTTFCERLPTWYEHHTGAEIANDGSWSTGQYVAVIGCDDQNVRLAIAPDRALADGVIADGS